jgi:DNA-binding beta-propeller fold protein YncE
MRPDTIFFRDGRLLLVDRAQWRAVAAGPEGSVQKVWDLQALSGLPEKERGRNDMGGVNLDPKGALLFTVPTIAKAFVLPLDGKPRVFGRSGSAPGSFGIPAGIAADEMGRLFVADRGRGVVMVFDPQLELLTEFGNDDGPAGLSRPGDLLCAGGKLYVTQSRDRGISVFRIAGGGAPAP